MLSIIQNEKIIKILIVDDHPIVTQGLEQLLNNEDDINVCGFAEDANTALSSIEKYNPDLAIIDISLKGGINGIELTKSIKNLYPNFPVLVLSMHDESIFAERALRAGARGYIMKQEMTGTIVQAIRSVIKGKIYLSEEMSLKLLDELMYNQPHKITDSIDKLANREFEVFQLIGDGYNTSDIAKKLNLSIKTIDTYRLRIKDKFNMKNSAELVKYAVKWMHNH